MTSLEGLKERCRRWPGPLAATLNKGWHLWTRLEELLWPLVALFRRVTRGKRERRVLGIFHFQEHAAYLGDMMEFLEVLNVLREEHGLAKVDLCYIDDPSNPNRPVSRDR